MRPLCTARTTDAHPVFVYIHDKKARLKTLPPCSGLQHTHTHTHTHRARARERGRGRGRGRRRGRGREREGERERARARDNARTTKITHLEGLDRNAYLLFTRHLPLSQAHSLRHDKSTVSSHAALASVDEGRCGQRCKRRAQQIFAEAEQNAQKATHPEFAFAELLAKPQMAWVNFQGRGWRFDVALQLAAETVTLVVVVHDQLEHNSLCGWLTRRSPFVHASTPSASRARREQGGGGGGARGQEARDGRGETE